MSVSDLFFVFGGFCFVVGVLIVFFAPVSHRVVDCVDGFHNVIRGLVCDEDSADEGYVLVATMIGCLGVISIFFSFMWRVYGND